MAGVRARAPLRFVGYALSRARTSSAGGGVVVGERQRLASPSIPRAPSLLLLGAGVGQMRMHRSEWRQGVSIQLVHPDSQTQRTGPPPFFT